MPAACRIRTRRGPCLRASAETPDLRIVLHPGPGVHHCTHIGHMDMMM